MDKNLDARLVDIVAPSVLVVEPQHGLDIGQHIAHRQELLNGLGDERRAAKSATNHHFKAGFTRAILVHAQGEIVNAQGGAVMIRRTDGNLELARQE